jgi:hypothetical protein
VVSVSPFSSDFEALEPVQIYTEWILLLCINRFHLQLKLTAETFGGGAENPPSVY